MDGWLDENIQMNRFFFSFLREKEGHPKNGAPMPLEKKEE